MLTVGRQDVVCRHSHMGSSQERHFVKECLQLENRSQSLKMCFCFRQLKIVAFNLGHLFTPRDCLLNLFTLS